MKLKQIIKELDEKNFPLHGKTEYLGIPIEIEQKKGTLRTGYEDGEIGNEAHQWNTKFKCHYGRIPGTETSDGDAIDVFLRPNTYSKDKVFIVKQKKKDTGKFDEIKVFLGFDNQEDVEDMFFDSNDIANEIFDGITEMSIDEFKKYLKINHKNLKAGEE